MAESSTYSSLTGDSVSLAPWRKDGCVIEGESFLLEPFKAAHVTEAYVSWLNDPEVTQYTRHGQSVYSLEKAQAYAAAVSNSPVTLVWAIRRKSDGLHAGNISLNDISWAHHSGEISVLIGEKKCWGGGAATESVRLITSFAFDSLDLHRVFVGMTVTNLAMIAVAKKNSFQEEGRLRDAFFKNGKYVDVTQWSKLNPKHG